MNKKTLEENGIEIAFPQRVVWLANASQNKEGVTGEAVA